MRLDMRGALVGLVLVVGGCASHAAPQAADPIVATPAEIVLGQQIAEQKCGACHAVGRTDHSAVPEAPAFRKLGERYPVSDLGEALAEGIVTGHPSMPDWVFSREEIVELLGYMQSIQTH